jgi:hypothetical protein
MIWANTAKPSKLNACLCVAMIFENKFLDFREMTESSGAHYFKKPKEYT